MSNRVFTNDGQHIDQTDWYKDAIIYELHVRAFADSDGNGIGDFKGLTGKLDYLRDLGVTAIWLLPFSPSPLRDDGYDTADYTGVHEAYGTLQDFKVFLREAHKRGLKVITELVLNHTSDQHPWFQRARTEPPGSKWRDFYVWSDTYEKYKEARIIFTDTEHSNWAWDPVAKAYYWHRFFSHQPDLNFDSPHVRRAIFQVIDFWFKLGIDGLRLDAVPYLYEREGTSCENLPETHDLLKELRAYIDSRYHNRMLLAEANQWPEDAVAYFGEGNECHMAFHFPLMPRLFMSLRMEDRFPILDILRQTPAIHESCQWAIFLRNHDELTLEMVTDEDRDYMYRVYAQDKKARINVGIRRRLAPLLGNHRRRIELLNALLLSMPGSPVIYYGDEIGMGDNIYLGDRNGVRTPMQWSPDRNAGFSRANPQQLYLPIIIDPEYHYEAINVEAQQNNTHSLLWWMRRMITLRKRYKSFGRGTLKFLHPDNRKVLVFLRAYEDEQILIVANLSRFAQAVEIDLSDYKGLVPREMFGRTEFPPIGDLPYFLTMGPHGFYWFVLEPSYVDIDQALLDPANGQVRRLTLASQDWKTVFEGAARMQLEAVLPAYLKVRRWFGGKSRTIQSAVITDAIPMDHNGDAMAYLALVNVRYSDGDPQMYVLPIAYAADEQATWVSNDIPHAVIARLKLRGQTEPGVLYDAIWNREFSLLPLEAIARQRAMHGDSSSEISASMTHTFKQFFAGLNPVDIDPSLVRSEQSHTSIVYDERFILKFFRRVEPGLNPELEVGWYLTEQGVFSHIPPVVGSLEYRRGKDEPITLAVLHRYIYNEGDAWSYTLDTLRSYFERLLTRDVEHRRDVPMPQGSLLALSEEEVPALAWELIDHYMESARLLGQRTAELHLALAQEQSNREFVPEPFTGMYQRSLYQTMRSQLGRVLQSLQKMLTTLPEPAQEDALTVSEMEEEILRRFRTVMEHKISSVRTRCHGDYHLGQVLFTGKDFVVIDFEGEPAKSLSERRRKRSPLTDVAGMLRSFHYAAYTALFNEMESGMIYTERVAEMEQWSRFWYRWVSATFLRAYRETAGQAAFMPQTAEETGSLLNVYLMDKAVYELGYELNNRPGWVRIPLWGIVHLLENG